MLLFSNRSCRRNSYLVSLPALRRPLFRQLLSRLGVVLLGVLRDIVLDDILGLSSVKLIGVLLLRLVAFELHTVECR